MNSIGRKKTLWWLFCKSLCIKVILTAVIPFLLLTLLSNSQARAEVIISPQIEIFVGPGDQGFHGIAVAFDSSNNRFMVVWIDGGVEALPTNLYGQLVNADGTLFGSPILISAGESDLNPTYPQVTFDSMNGRFLVVWHDGWMDSNGVVTTCVLGQFINSDGAPYGNNFAISPVPPDPVPSGYDYHEAGAPRVQFDTVNNRFFIIWVRSYRGWPPYNIYGQFVNPYGSLNGSVIQLTNYGTDYYVANPLIVFDQNNGRFLLTWANQYDAYIYGRLINADGTFYGSEITVGQYCLGCVYVASTSFDPINNKFIQTWWRYGIQGQLINEDGTLYGTEFIISPPGSTTGNHSVVFDTSSSKFLLAGDIQDPYLGIVGQFLNPDGSLYGTDFPIFEVVYDGREGNMGGYPPFIASGSAQTGSLGIWMDVPYWSTSRIDVFGKFVKIVEPNISVTPTSHDFGSVYVKSSSAPQTFTISNIGGADLIIDTITVTGGDASQFSIQSANDSCSGNTIVSSGSCTISVAFSPTSGGIKSATLTIPSNDPDKNPLDIPLTGTGVTTLSVSTSPTNGGTVLGTGINCPGDCTETYTTAASVILSANPAQGFSFGSWTGCSSTNDNQCTVTMDLNRNITATFLPLTPLPDLSGYWSNVSKSGPSRKGVYKISGTFTVTNSGPVNANDVVVKSYFSNDSIPDAADDLIKTAKYKTIRAGSSNRTTINFSTSTPPGGKVLIAVIDPSNIVTESDETNNVVYTIVP